MRDNFQEQPLENFMDDDNNKYENVENFLLLTTELLEKDKKIGIMKKSIDKNNEELFKKKFKYKKRINTKKVMLRNKSMKKLSVSVINCLV